MINSIILLICHLLGDFYFQSNKLAKCKNAVLDDNCKECSSCKDKSFINIKYLFIHVLIYCLPFLLLFFITNWKNVLMILIIVFISHLVIDLFTCWLKKKTKKTIVFIIDQILHVGILVIINQCFSFNLVFEPYFNFIKIIFCGLFTLVPSSIMINILFSDIYPEEKENNLFSVGSLIGMIERLLIFILAYCNAILAIAIIITIKTWARAEDIKDKNFRNKYLLGTLLSFVLGLCSFLIFNYL